LLATEHETPPGDELAVVEALLEGSTDAPPVEVMDDLTAPALPPHASEDDIEIKAEAVSDDPEGGVIEVSTPAPAPPPEAPSRAPRERAPTMDRVTAFADRVAQDRARDMLGDDFEPIVAGMAGAQKKVAEKVYNGLCYLADRGKLSIFTRVALDKLLIEQEATTSGLVKAYMECEKHYGESTARSQATQMMSVLPILKLAKREGSKLILDNESPVLKLFIEAGTRTPGDPVPKAPRKAKQKDTTPDPEAALDALSQDDQGSAIEDVVADDENLLSVADDLTTPAADAAPEGVIAVPGLEDIVGEDLSLLAGDDAPEGVIETAARKGKRK
jgi:hypothetical protein